MKKQNYSFLGKEKLEEISEKANVIAGYITAIATGILLGITLICFTIYDAFVANGPWILTLIAYGLLFYGIFMALSTMLFLGIPFLIAPLFKPGLLKAAALEYEQQKAFEEKRLKQAMDDEIAKYKALDDSSEELYQLYKSSRITKKFVNESADEFLITIKELDRDKSIREIFTSCKFTVRADEIEFEYDESEFLCYNEAHYLDFESSRVEGLANMISRYAMLRALKDLLLEKCIDEYSADESGTECTFKSPFHPKGVDEPDSTECSIILTYYAENGYYEKLQLWGDTISPDADSAEDEAELPNAFFGRKTKSID